MQIGVQRRLSVTQEVTVRVPELNDSRLLLPFDDLPPSLMSTAPSPIARPTHLDDNVAVLAKSRALHPVMSVESHAPHGPPSRRSMPSYSALKSSTSFLCCLPAMLNVREGLRGACHVSSDSRQKGKPLADMLIGECDKRFWITHRRRPTRKSRGARRQTFL